MDYIEKIGKGQWKCVMRITLLIEEKQSLLFNGDFVPDGSDLIPHSGSLIRIDRWRK
jgi:hypothetical protein